VSRSVSRIRPIRRILLKLAMWGDPEAMLSEDGEAEACFSRAKRGSLEDQIRLERGYYARRYLLGRSFRKAPDNG
jgi:hypothetical protein